MKKSIYNYFIFTFALLIITTLNEKEVLGLSLSNEHVTKNNYIELTEMASNSPNPEAEQSSNSNNEVIAVFQSSNSTISLTKDDIYLMSQVVYAESKGEPFDGKIAVASVILNRTTDSQFPDTIHGVITQKNAFSCVRNGKIDVVPDGDSYNAVLKAIEGYDPTDEALYFYNPKIATCSWMKGVEKTGEKIIGQHVFFNVT
ncbi:cell wall hydrolase [Clostridium perfringens]|uniref:Spore cortex-lytic protein n=2 Tax=Clostridium perfringens TaxID=1502 RepID=A0A2X2WDG6_CLOPF|nr:cell wall hydrolase [Clostridium perfringens]ABG85507.1 putative spore-cortex-lytic enzyme [Clostridium perfringens SM101]EJT5916460.1 cell wall hydrolase [Clostridium perfringens]EJT5924217.1 cell wall hydrolase [Clostridium perfringens]EJT5939071.1 cell wall hydrolase [Clostridium perfringens]EJT6135188.1 cell wall hydrolase [Clostridium perfringens]